MSQQTIETLTERDLAGMLRCTPAALRRMRRENRGPRWCRVGRLVRYPLPWVQHWLQANEGSTQVTNGGQGNTISAISSEIGGPDAN